MIIKSYAVYCDLCNTPLGEVYYGYKPAPTKLRQDDIKVIINNGKVHTFCEECYNKIKGKRNEKIMFSDKYGLTEAVLDGRKTMMRRIIPKSFFSLNWDVREDENTLVVENDFGDFIDIRHTGFARYKVGEVVAVAQSYRDAGVMFIEEEDEEFGCHNFPAEQTQGWTNKMFVRADLMPHQIRIANVKVERLQDISDEDCIKEGIYKDECSTYFNGYAFETLKDQYGNVLAKRWYRTPREAYAALIDKISGKGTWESNPYVFAYEFELVK